MQENTPTCLFNIHIEREILVKIPHSVTAGQSNTIQSKYLVGHHVSEVRHWTLNKCCPMLKQ